MFRSLTQVPVGVVLLLVLQLFLPFGAVQPASAQETGTLYVYNQITNLPEGVGTVGYPVLSGDGSKAVFSQAPTSEEPDLPNTIYTINADGSGLTEVDSYTPLCFCGPQVDISNDGGTVVSTESVQLRIVDGGGPRELLRLASGEISALIVTGNGQTVYFLIRRDTGTSDGATVLPRGVWAIDANGGNLRQVIDVNEVAGAVRLPVEQTGCCFHGDGRPLDASDDGSRIVFAAFVGTGEHVFSADGGGGSLVLLRTDLQYAMRVAISGDGSLAAYDATPVGAAVNEVAVVSPDGGTPQVLANMPYSGYDEPFQLSQTGSRLLVSSNGFLFDTASGTSVLLGASILGLGGNHDAVITDGLPRGTMDANAENFLYVMRTVRCADCVNLQEQLATLALDPVDLGEAPFIANGAIDPGTIALNRESEATVTANIDVTGELLGTGFVALLGNEVDLNVGRDLAPLDDGQNSDAAAGDGVFTVSGITHSPVLARENDLGPRVIRISAETEGTDGLRHATALDIGTLSVEDAAART